MPVRANLERPDYISGVGQSLGGIANVVDQLSPMDPRMQRAIFAVIGGGDPKQVAAALRGGMQAPEMPAATGAPSAPQALPAASNISQTPTGFEEDITVTAPPREQAKAAPAELPLAPFARRDAPMLMQLAQATNKHDPLAMEKLLYNYEALGERRRQFNELEELRDARAALAKAQAAAIPEQVELARVRVRQAEDRLGISRLGLETRRTENFLKGTAETAQAVPQLRSVIADLKLSPGVAPPDWDYATRKVGRIMGGLPFVGNSLREGFDVVADTALTPQQRAIRSRIQQAIQPYRKLAVGSQITAGEAALMDVISGQGFSVGDQIAALMALERSMTARHARVEAGYPEMPSKIPMARPEDVMPPIPGAWEDYQQPGRAPNLPGPSPDYSTLEEALRGGR